jgi:hypothetical protein
MASSGMHAHIECKGTPDISPPSPLSGRSLCGKYPRPEPPLCSGLFFWFGAMWVLWRLARRHFFGRLFSAAAGIVRHPAVSVLSAVAPVPALSEVIVPRRVSMFDTPPKGQPLRHCRGRHPDRDSLFGSRSCQALVKSMPRPRRAEILRFRLPDRAFLGGKDSGGYLEFQRKQRALVSRPIEKTNCKSIL